MLIRFAVENWMSFRDEATLSMIATSERQHSERLRSIKTYRARILPIASIYGGNASGKSNLVKAIGFAKDLITAGPKTGLSTGVRPFRLEKKYEKLPTKFRFEILIEEVIYEYSFALTPKQVIYEQLKRFRATKEEVLFSRTAQSLKLSSEFGESTALQINFQGTKDNQLFLTNSVSQKRPEFKKIFDWFDHQLQIVFPQSTYGGLPDITSRRNSLLSKIISLLKDFDSGISNLEQVDIPLERIPDIVMSVLDDEPEGTQRTFEAHGHGLVFVSKKDDQYRAKKLATIHKAQKGQNVVFGLDEESDGTRRLLDLLPAFLFLEQSPNGRVFIIDEFDRSLHSLLATKLVERFISNTNHRSSSQLIYTTHNLQLMDQRLLRRDEIWITERDSSGNSNLLALSEFREIRNDKDIRKSYLQGRMGGIPKLKSRSSVKAS